MTAQPTHTAPGPPAQAQVHGHFGELVQGRIGPGGPLALLTLPCPLVSVRAHFVPGGVGLRCADPLGRAMAARVAPKAEGELTLAASLPGGLGAGISTATALAALRVLAPGLSPEAESAHLLAIEGAVDPLAHPPAPVRLWAPRAAQTLDILPPLPAMIAVGGFDGPGQRTDPADQDFPDMRAAFELLRGGDAAAVGRAASLSASANQARNPRPNWQAAQALAARVGALGLSVAHTGAALGLLFAADAPAGALAQAQQGLRALGLCHVARFGFGSSLP